MQANLNKNSAMKSLSQIILPEESNIPIKLCFTGINSCNDI